MTRIAMGELYIQDLESIEDLGLLAPNCMSDIVIIIEMDDRDVPAFREVWQKAMELSQQMSAAEVRHGLFRLFCEI